MAIEDVLVSFNPMDIVRGYEYGIEKGQTREKNDEEIRRNRLLNQIAELEKVPAAQFQGMQTSAKIAGFDPTSATEIARLGQQTELSATARKAAEENRSMGDLTGRLIRRTALAGEENAPEAIAIDVEGARSGRKGRAAQAGGAATYYENLQEEQAAVGEAAKLLREAERIDYERELAEPNSPKVDGWTRANTVMGQTKNLRAQEIIKRQRDQYAVQGIGAAAQAGDVQTMNTWLKRYGVDREVGIISTPGADGRPIAAWQLYSLQPQRDAAGNTVMQRVPVGGFISSNPRDDDWIGRVLPQQLGIQIPQQQRRSGAATQSRPVSQRPPLVPKAIKPVTEEPKGAGKSAAGPEGAPLVTDKMREDLRVWREQQEKQMRQGAPKRSAAPPDVGQQIAALGEADRTQVEQLANQAQRIGTLMQTAEGNTVANGRLYAVLRQQIDELLAKGPPGGATRPGAVT